MASDLNVVATRLTRLEMLQTDVRRKARLVLPSFGLAGWIRRQRDVLAPQLIIVLGVLVVVCGAWWAADEYAHHKAEVRAAETSRFLAEFESGAVADAWMRLQRAWAAERPRQEALLARLSGLRGTERARALHDYHLFVLETIDEHELQDEIEIVHRFLGRLATCVRVGSCDQDVAAADLGPELWAFRNQHHQYFHFEYSGVDLDRDLETVAPLPMTAGGGAERPR